MIRGALLAGLLLLGCAGAAVTQEPAEGAEEADPIVRTDAGLRLDFQQADLRVVLTSLAEAAGLNIVYSQLPSKTVTLRTARPVPRSEVRALLESVARANGLRLVEEAGILRIVAPEPGEAARQAREDEERRGARAAGGAQPRLFVYRLRHAKAGTIAQTLQALFGGGGGFGGVEGRGGLALSEALDAQRAQGYEAMRPRPEAERPAGEPRPAPGDARRQREGTAVALQGPVHIVPDVRSNSMLVLARPGDYETVRDAIERLDTRPLQVLIEVLVAEIRRDDNFAFGASIDVPKEGDEGTSLKLQGLSAGDVVLRVLGIGSVDATAVLRALAASSDVKILSRPMVLAQNNREARILVGDQRPFIQLFRALPTDEAVRDQVVQYRDVGTELRIVPTINPDGYVNLTVLQQVSSATAEVQFGAPVINTREASTDVLVRDGHTAVLGGLVDHQTEESDSGIPLLKDIPVLGGLFGTTSKRRVATELFILLTPHIVGSDEEMEDAVRRLRGSTERLEEHITEPSSLLRDEPGALPPLPSPDPASPRERPRPGGAR